MTPWRLATHWIMSPDLGVSGEKAVDSVPPTPPKNPRRACCRETQKGSLPSGNHVLISKLNSLNKERLSPGLVLITHSLC